MQNALFYAACGVWILFWLWAALKGSLLEVGVAAIAVLCLAIAMDVRAIREAVEWDDPKD